MTQGIHHTIIIYPYLSWSILFSPKLSSPEAWHATTLDLVTASPVLCGEQLWHPTLSSGDLFWAPGHPMEFPNDTTWKLEEIRAARPSANWWENTPLVMGDHGTYLDLYIHPWNLPVIVSLPGCLSVCPSVYWAICLCLAGCKGCYFVCGSKKVHTHRGATSSWNIYRSEEWRRIQHQTKNAILASPQSLNGNLDLGGSNRCKASECKFMSPNKDEQK